ncbi:hypothetical protein AMAG_17666 [Allomyces macrogynus ATCC 38327]|uniref:Serine/threonine-protein kinase TEL1 n=1 Tax=Allomyces macrogynus (strain ATCC 38327) TaxID=578462 RepID=A0A0L0RVP9_ALLM3|nr:hypothetical protein AMAG_17666 [Allomyces macrogynus ATCC 38327]|eukprot:KNE54393.1 hypothetical protein AMAG_17666 [Allomyces macrogynus ATCC 38327]
MMAHPHHTLSQMFAPIERQRTGVHGAGLQPSGRVRRVRRVAADRRQQAARTHCPGTGQPARAASDVSKVALDRTTKLRSVQDLTHVPVTTITIPHDADPTTFPTIRKFKPEYSLVGCVNAPKLVEIHGSDGKNYKALVKGNDDLRQDGTLMHVFGVVDQLLNKHGATRQRNLTIRTYKVVQLADKWFEQKPSAEEWFHGRLQFARSCAATSIMGSVVGLGDRHSQNILLDTETAQLVHIDLGIAFPFRLTQNILDGLGVKGVECVFRRCCEETLRVLRQESRVIMTILEVLKFDPLYSWMIDPQKMLRVQRARAGAQSATPEQEGDDASPSNRPTSAATPNSNEEAERALLGVRRKLDDRVSVECVVNDLIQTATNAENLASLFSGWQAYLKVALWTSAFLFG